MKVSNRLRTINGDGSDGWDVFYRARRMAMAGEPVVELTIGEHDIRTHSSILDAMARAAAGGHTGYAMVPGVDALRDAVATRITERTGVPTNRSNILITPGGQSALFAAHMVAADAGDTGLFCDPYYATYPSTIRGAGLTPVSVPCHAEEAFQPAEADLRAVADGAKTLLINTPNNPTGVVYSHATIDGICAVCRDHDLWLISDEVYDTQIWEGAHVTPRAQPGMVDRTLVVGSMSKSHAMTGSRVGWVCGPAHVIEHLIDLATNTTYGVPGYIQDAALFALNAGDALEAEVAAPFKRRRALALDVLSKQNLIKAIPSGGAMYIMLDIRPTGLSGEQFANQLLDGEGVAVMPGESFGSAAAGHIRVAMTVDDASFEAALNRICAFAMSLAKHEVAN